MNNEYSFLKKIIFSYWCEHVEVSGDVDMDVRLVV